VGGPGERPADKNQQDPGCISASLRDLVFIGYVHLICQSTILSKLSEVSTAE
jgi:hypothetical protein